MKYNDRQKKRKKGKRKEGKRKRGEASLWFFFSKILNPFITITWKV